MRTGTATRRCVTATRTILTCTTGTGTAEPRTMSCLVGRVFNPPTQADYPDGGSCFDSGGWFTPASGAGRRRVRVRDQLRRRLDPDSLACLGGDLAKPLHLPRRQHALARRRRKPVGGLKVFAGRGRHSQKTTCPNNRIIFNRKFCGTHAGTHFLSAPPGRRGRGPSRSDGKVR